MPIRPHPALLILALAGATAPALAAGVPAVAVQPRVFKRPRLPADASVPMNVPEDGAVRMPLVSGGAPGVARRINEAVWHAMLEGVPVPTGPGPSFSTRPDDLPQGTTTLDFTAALLPAATPRLLSLDFTGESCGAYCETFQVTRLFDLRDGRALSLGDLVSVEGLAAVGRRVDAERRRAYRKQLHDLGRASAQHGKKAKQDDDDTDDRIFLAQECLAQVDSQPATPQWLLSYRFALDGHGGLLLTVGRCSNHAMRALDDVGDITVAVAAKDLTPTLTPYGLAVLQQAGDAPPSAAPYARELHGRLGGMAITMQLDAPHDGADTRGWYAYDKYHTPIALSVHQDGDVLTAVEQAAAGGRFELRDAGGALLGTWSDAHGRKQRPVVLK
jgi:hypothetical protein